MMPMSISATLDYAATLAYASRLFSNSEFSELKARAPVYEKAAVQAWLWAEQNPNKKYVQPKDVNTGLYARGDDNFIDEWSLAATELFLLTNKKPYLKKIQLPQARPSGTSSEVAGR